MTEAKRTTPTSTDLYVPLISDILRHPVEPSYQEAHDRHGGQSSRTTPGLIILTCTLLIIGAIFAVSATTLKVTAPNTRARASLIEEIEKKRVDIDSSTAQIDRLRAQVSTLRESRLRQQGESSAAGAVQAAEFAAAAAPATGDGITITLDDSAASQESGQGRRPASDHRSRIQAQDVQSIVNQLWANGAEAISINNHRLTSLATIRFAGDAILVAYRPLAKPYVVTALGPASMAEALDNPQARAYLSTLRATTGAAITVATASTLTVPAGTGLSLRFATPNPTATSGGTP